MPLASTKVVEEEEGSSGGDEMLEDDNKSHELADDYDSNDEMFQSALKAKYLQKKQQLNIRKVTADFNSYFIEPKTAASKETTPPKEQPEVSPTFALEVKQAIPSELSPTVVIGRKESFTYECD
jgi:hypothetical protein